MIVQTSLTGSILLLVLGIAFFAGGINRVEQNFNTTVVQAAAPLLTVSCASLIAPAAFNMASSTPGDVGLAQLSRGTSVILLLVYGSYLFQPHTHLHLYNVRSRGVSTASLVRRNRNSGEGSPSTSQHPHINSTAAEGPAVNPEEEEQEAPALTVWFAIGVLVASAIFIALCAECLVDSINHPVTSAGISHVSVGLILLPVVGNATGYVTTVTATAKDKMDLVIGVAVGW